MTSLNENLSYDHWPSKKNDEKPRHIKGTATERTLFAYLYQCLMAWIRRYETGFPGQNASLGRKNITGKRAFSREVIRE